MSRGESTFRAVSRSRPDAEQMVVAALFHRYVPAHGAGAEWMAHALLRDLVARGHRVRVMVSHPDPIEAADVDGVTVERWDGTYGQFGGVDVVVTHLDRTRNAIYAAHAVGAPVVHLLHNHRQLRYHRVHPSEADLVIANSRWVRDAYPGWPGAIEVIHPPVDVDDYTVGYHTGDMVTLVNLSVAKGGLVLFDVAEQMPRTDFLAVTGAYAPQVTNFRAVPPNVELIANTSHMRDDVYARTKVLLIPSSYESWGRVGIEAACSGIVSVAAPTQGLVESLADCAVWRDLGDVAGWVDAIDGLLDDQELYERMSGRAYSRARELDPKLGDYDRFEALMLDVVRGHTRAC